MKVLKTSQLSELASKAAEKALAQRGDQRIDSKTNNVAPPVVIGFLPPS